MSPAEEQELRAQLQANLRMVAHLHCLLGSADRFRVQMPGHTAAANWTVERLESRRMWIVRKTMAPGIEVGRFENVYAAMALAMKLAGFTQEGEGDGNAQPTHVQSGDGPASGSEEPRQVDDGNSDPGGCEGDRKAAGEKGPAAEDAGVTEQTCGRCGSVMASLSKSGHGNLGCLNAKCPDYALLGIARDAHDLAIPMPREPRSPAEVFRNPPSFAEPADRCRACGGTGRVAR
jgi:hypothetical protein